MDPGDKAIARSCFRFKIQDSDGQSFENLFVDIMGYYDLDFKPIKPWGNIGDRKNDGYIKTKGIFYQVYAPENIKKSYVNAIKKLKVDFQHLKNAWPDIKEFYFVVNDKYKGVNADCEIAIQKIEEENGLVKARILIARDIENILFSLSEDQIIKVVGQLPDPASLKNLDYSVLNEVINHIMQLPIDVSSEFRTRLPGWEEKIRFNNLSVDVAKLLDSGFIQVHSLEKYLSNQGNFLADSLRDYLSEAYSKSKIKCNGDELFWSLVNKLSPRAQYPYQSTVIIILAKYFEACDVFEEPLVDGDEMC